MPKTATSHHPCLPDSLLQEFQSDPLLSKYLESESAIYGSQFEKYRVKALSHQTPLNMEVVEPAKPGSSPETDGPFDRFGKGDAGTWLHIAAREGDVPLAYECIRIGIPLNHTAKMGATPLVVACDTLRVFDDTREHIEQTMRDRPRDLERDNGLGNTIFPDQTERTFRVAKLLIEQHCDVNLGIMDISPVIIAARCSCWPLVELLLRYGAHVPDQLEPYGIFRSRAQKNKLLKLVHETKPLDPLSPRPCPCWSGKLIPECHAAGHNIPYPPEFMCKCGKRKSFGECCSKKQFIIYEGWSEAHGCIISTRGGREWRPTTVDPDDPVYQEAQRRTDILGPLFHMQLENQKITNPELYKSEQSAMMQDLLGHRSDVDLAFLAVIKPLPADRWPRVWTTMYGKVECKARMDEWNAAVDEYIKSGVDARPKFDIELGAKIGMNGGPLYRHCEAGGCSRVERRDVERMKCCSGCRLIYYCSSECQRSDWKRHKSECKVGSHPEQRLPSQAALEEELVEGAKGIATARNREEFLAVGYGRRPGRR